MPSVLKCNSQGRAPTQAPIRAVVPGGLSGPVSRQAEQGFHLPGVCRCTPAGLVRINWRLMQAPAHLIDYVVVHELAHIVEANHSSRFWAVVERGYREHRQARRELSEWQRRLAAL